MCLGLASLCLFLLFLISRTLRFIFSLYQYFLKSTGSWEPIPRAPVLTSLLTISLLKTLSTTAEQRAALHCTSEAQHHTHWISSHMLESWPAPWHPLTPWEGQPWDASRSRASLSGCGWAQATSGGEGRQFPRGWAGVLCSHMSSLWASLLHGSPGPGQGVWLKMDGRGLGWLGHSEFTSLSPVSWVSHHSWAAALSHPPPEHYMDLVPRDTASGCRGFPQENTLGLWYAFHWVTIQHYAGWQRIWFLRLWPQKLLSAF